LTFTPTGQPPKGNELDLPLVWIGGNNNAAFSGGMDWGTFSYGVREDDRGYIVLSRLPGMSAAAESVMGIPGAQSLMWFTQQDNLRKRMGELRFSNPILSTNAWARTYGERSNIHSGATGRGFKAELWGLDIGADKGFQLDMNNQLFVGAFAGYGKADQDFRRTNGKSEATQGGVYATWLNACGLYADATLKAAHFENKFSAYDQSRNRTSGDYSNWGLGASVEMGWQKQFAQGWFAEPMVQIGYAHMGGRDYTTGNAMAMSVRQRDADVWQFRTGARAGKTFAMSNDSLLQPYVKMGVVEQVSSSGRVEIGGAGWRPNLDGTRIELGAGVAWQMNAHSQLHLDYQAALGQKYDKPVGINLGFRHQF